jgi:hypothetical protein
MDFFSSLGRFACFPKTAISKEEGFNERNNNDKCLADREHEKIRLFGEKSGYKLGNCLAQWGLPK